MGPASWSFLAVATLVCGAFGAPQYQAATPTAAPGVSTTTAPPPIRIGTCPRGCGRMLLSEPAVRAALPYGQATNVIEYYGRGRHGARDCRAECVVVESPLGWKPADVSITAGALGTYYVQVSLLSAPQRGYSSRVTLYGTCKNNE